ncbi:hypothetical protein [Amycolatopsis sp. NPDC051903]|uniref:hypothetical protein n=1 Tax=Amycolatopsis sp. NPDC051903 TaxID=3363936 RepID=UPI0037AB568C
MTLPHWGTRAAIAIHDPNGQLRAERVLTKISRNGDGDDEPGRTARTPGEVSP